jgi:hypothetical protein
MEENTTRSEAERLLGIAEKLLQNRDLNSARDFALLAQETEPLLDGSDQILAVVDVLIAADKRINNHPDWYAILQLDRRNDDLDLIKKQYRRLALLLHPDKNKFAFADSAFKLVADSWAVLSEPSRKSTFDNDFNRFTKVDLSAMRRQREFDQHNQNDLSQHKLPVRRNNWTPNSPAPAARTPNFWTACPYCYHLYEFPRVYEGCCLRCQNCQRAYHAAVVPSLPPMVPGKDEYYCCWGFFPMGFVASESGKNPGFPAPTHRTTTDIPNGNGHYGGADGYADDIEENAAQAPPPAATARPSATGTGKKRGRPRKNV